MSETKIIGTAALARKALKGLSRCMPESRREDLGCADCPYHGKDCRPEEMEEARMFPPAMIRDIRLALRAAAKMG